MVNYFVSYKNSLVTRTPEYVTCFSTTVCVTKHLMLPTSYQRSLVRIPLEARFTQAPPNHSDMTEILLEGHKIPTSLSYCYRPFLITYHPDMTEILLEGHKIPKSLPYFYDPKLSTVYLQMNQSDQSTLFAIPPGSFGHITYSMVKRLFQLIITAIFWGIQIFHFYSTCI